MVSNYFYFIIGENTFYPSEVFTDLHFCLQSLKCDTLTPSKLSNCGNSTTLAFLFPKCPYHKFFFKKKKNQKKKKNCWGGWPPHLATPRPAVWGWPNHLQWPMG